MSLTVYPTHTCFDDALDLFAQLVKEEVDLRPRLRLVHGIIAPDGRRLAHAWLEDRALDTVIFIGLVNGRRQQVIIERRDYYARAGVITQTAYTWRQAYHWNRRTGHYGPWVEAYRRLCRRPDP